jgi:predicted enzyme related to lactoylglutathione lyase
MDIRIQCLCIDTTDPGRLAKFWQAVLGWRLDAGPDGNEFCVLRALGSQDQTYEGVPG